MVNLKYKCVFYLLGVINKSTNLVNAYPESCTQQNILTKE